MTSREALTALFNEANRLSCEEPKYTTHDLWEMAKLIQDDLDVLHLLANMLDNNTLYRFIPYDKAKIISEYIDRQSRLHPEIKKVLERISNEEWLENE